MLWTLSPARIVAITAAEAECDQKWLPTSNSLGNRQEIFFFHANVAKQPGSELIMRSLIFNCYEPRM